jgi:YbbR domain-containing protein
MKDLIFRNISLKILSFFFAISLWLFVNLKATTESALQIPVLWQNVPSFLVITNEVNDSIRVKVAGPRRILSHLEPSRLAVTLDLSDAKVGLSNYQINEKMIHLPPGLTATVLPPDILQFKLELTVTKGVEVRPRFRGKPAEGYAVDGVELVPNRIEIVGAQSEVQGISQVHTEAVDLTNKRESFRTKVKIALDQPHAWPSKGQGEVEVRVTMAEETVQRFLKQISLQVENVRGPVRLEPSRVDIVLEGPAGKIHALSPDRIVASVVLPKEGPLPETLPVIVRLPVEDLHWSCDPAKVGVKALPREEARPGTGTGTGNSRKP